MATTTLISSEEYLRTSDHPDRDYGDRHLGEYEHGGLQAGLSHWIHSPRDEWNIRVLSDTPCEPVRVTPRLLSIDILSSKDRIAIPGSPIDLDLDLDLKEHFAQLD